MAKKTAPLKPSRAVKRPLVAPSPAPMVAFPVVAIGASAGGLAAFTAVLEALPPKSGMAFVLIQHLEPKHESALTGLLSKATRIPVMEVSEGTVVERDHVYVIPPNKSLTIRHGILHLTPRSNLAGLHLPIDEFCLALAREQGSAAVAVVLSGTGSDGTYGLKAIKAEGGITFAQEPKTAQWPAMPESAIAHGSVDFILSPKRIAAELARIGTHPYLAEAGGIAEGSDLDEVCLTLRSTTGIDFRLYKPATVHRRIARRMALQKIANLATYAQILQENPPEARALAGDIFIHVTGFFRDPACFQALQKKVLAKFQTRWHAGDPLRIWVAGCSSGEEVYSVAILLLEQLGEHAAPGNVQIFGTDIQESAIAHARSGIYSVGAVSGVSAARLKRFFKETAGGYQIQKLVRDLCVFARHDLAKDPPFSKLDLVSCRNVLIYMGPALQKRLLATFHYALNPGGFLFLGHSESVGASFEAFTPDDRENRIFMRKPAAGTALEDVERPNGEPVRSFLDRQLANTRAPLHSLIAEHETAQEEIKAATEEMRSSNEELQSTNEELETAKEELQSSNEELTTLNDELQRRNRDLNLLMDDLRNLLVGVDLPVLVLDADLRVRRFTPVAGTLLNLIPGDVGRPFADIASTLPAVDWNALLTNVESTGQIMEREVTDKDGRWYSLRIRPYKTSGNTIDGVLVVLYDTDANKRALQQAEEAQHLSDSILNSLVANVAVLNAVGTILATNDAWNRFARENGNPPLTAVGPSANYVEVCRRAANSGDSDAKIVMNGIEDVLAGRRTFFQFEYPCHSPSEQRWFLMNAAPLKGGAGGAVITHTDISDRKLAEISLQTSESLIRALLSSAPQAVVAVDAQGKIVFVNGNVARLFGYAREELLGQQLDLLIPESARPQHRDYQKSYFANMQSRPMGLGLNLEARRKDGSLFPVEIGLGAVSAPTGKVAVAFVSDITERRRMEQAAQAHAAEIHSLAASLLTAQEEERRRVSRELHDQICQQLASLAIEIGSLAIDLPVSGSVHTRLKALQSRVVKASEETRHIAYELHPSVLDDLGLVASLQDLGKEFSKQTKIGVKFTHDALPASMPREIGSCLYRVAQESLQNVIKHANAKHVTMAVNVRKGSLVLTISDDGSGFDPQSVKGRGGLGLIGMEERASLVDGKLSIAAQPRRGTRIALEIPLPAAAV